jgi:hypothetical protein
MTRHASAEDLASLDLDGLKARKAARIRTHVSSCVRCTQLSSQVSAVPTVLASVSYPSIPSTFSAQLDTTLASESARRLANAPATEADRGALPDRRARRPVVSWQILGMSPLATRLVAAAGALVVVGAGGYEIATHVGGGVSTTSASSSGSASVPSARQVTLGPRVAYGQAAGSKTVRTVYSAENFTAADLGPQALAAVSAANIAGAGSAQPARVSAPNASASTFTKNSNNSATSHAGSPTSLTSCLDGIAGNQTVRLVETAKYEGRPATIIVTAASTTHPGQVWVVGPACSASHPDVYAHQTLSGT